MATLNAISAFAGWFGAIGSFAAVFAAIRIPQVIAEQQNSIALFDKRYNAYDALAFLVATVKQIADGSTKGMDPKLYLGTVVDRYKAISIVKVIASDCKEPADLFTQLIFEAGKIGFLFELKEIEAILDFLLAIDQYVSDVYKGNLVNERPLIEAYNKLDSSVIQEKIEKQLNLSPD